MARWGGDTGIGHFSNRDSGEIAAAARSGVSAASSGFPAAIDLATLDGTNGVRLSGTDRADLTGLSVSDAGDVNGDGFDDIIIGAPGAGSTGASYVVFGRAGAIPASFDLAALDGTNGFRLEGVYGGDQSGRAVSSAGDVNGDGFDDIMIGAPFSGGSAEGETYVVFGHGGGFAPSLDLASLDGTDGFRIDGVGYRTKSGYSVSSAGDVNGDGFDDIIIGSYTDKYRGEESYVVFGKAGGFAPSLDLASLDGANGFRLTGADDAYIGGAVSSAGDVNGDGFDDLIIGASYGYGAGGVSTYGESYIVFGKAEPFAATVDLGALDGDNGVRIKGAYGSLSGYSVSSAGDVNGDGFDDVIIGAPGHSYYSRQDPAAYVVFGRADGYPADFSLTAIDGANGFALSGIGDFDKTGVSVSSAGDVNGDGFDDVIVGADRASGIAGDTYVVFGHAGGFAASLDLATLDGSNGFRLDGVDPFDRSGGSVSGAGDVNGDGFDDIVIGAANDYFYPSSAGESYVVFGRAPDEAVRRVGSAAGQTIRGGDFDDILLGRGGDDMLAGGAGRDELKGGGGADDLLLASIDPDDADAILDFGRGDDRIALDGDVFGLAEGALAPGRFVIGMVAQDSTDRLIYDDATGRLFFDADGTGAEAQVLIATLTGAPAIAASDIVVI